MQNQEYIWRYDFINKILGIKVRSMNDQLQMSKWYVNKGIDSLIFWKTIPFIGTKHLKAWHLVTPVSRRASLREQRRLQFHRQKMWSTRGCDCRTVTEKFSWPVLYSYVNVNNPVPRDFIPSSRTIALARILMRADWSTRHDIASVSYYDIFYIQYRFTCIDFILLLNYNVVWYIKFEGCQFCVCVCVCVCVCCTQ